MSATDETARQEEALYSLSETARMFGVSERTIHRWIREGRIPVYRLGRQLRFRKSDLEAFLEERREVPLARTPPLDFGQGRRDAFLERVKDYIETRVAHYEQRLSEAEQGGLLSGYEGARTLFDDALDEFLPLPDLINGELAERWMLNPEVPEDVKVDLGRTVGDIMLKPLAGIVERIGRREAELAETEAQRIEAERRRKQMIEKSREIAQQHADEVKRPAAGE